MSLFLCSCVLIINFKAKFVLQALAGAKQVHTFDRSADETISWIHEKDTVLSSEDFGHDLESIQALVRRHEGFEVSI